MMLAVVITMHAKAFLMAFAWLFFGSIMFSVFFDLNNQKAKNIAGYIVLIPTILFALLGAVTFILAP